MILGSDVEQLELTVAEVHRSVPGLYAGGDVRVAVRVRTRDFAGAVNAWILRESWDAFRDQLSGLERVRSGEAILESISADELRLRFFAIDRAGHMAVEGHMTAYSTGAHRPDITSLKFAAVEIDPTSLPSLIRELDNAVPAA